MGFWGDLFGRGVEPVPTPVGGELVTNFDWLEDLVEGLSPAELYRTQPHLRTVVSFLARNIAKLGLHVYERDNGSRDRVRDCEAALVFQRPGAELSAYDVVYALVANLALYDKAYLWVTETTAGRVVWPIPVPWVVREKGNAFEIEELTVLFPGKTVETHIPMSEVVRFNGWSPDNMTGTSSPVCALRDILREQIRAVAFRNQVWERGGRMTSIVTRPLGAPVWSDDARKRFKDEFKAQYANAGTQAGGSLLLEEGMDVKPYMFNAREAQWVEVAKLSLATVAGVYHVNPTMVGQLDNANYSNVREFRKSLYGDSLGPTIKAIEDRLNQKLLPMLGFDPARFYYEFNVAAQLRGTPEEQAAALSSSVGAPWVTRNEARAMQNKPAIPGGDELVTPLNVLTGGQASPRDSAPKSRVVKDRTYRLRVKSMDLVDDDDRDSAAGVIKHTFERQRRAVKSSIVNGLQWDEKRWDLELAADLYDFAIAVTERVGRDAAEALGYRRNGYDVELTGKFLTAVTGTRASWINEATRRQLAEALADADDDESATDIVDRVFDRAISVRALSGGAAIAAFCGSFAVQEAVQQLRPERAMKRWIVQSANPRGSHAAVDGETVPMGEVFSNGMEYPGDPNGGADEVAGCQCGLEVVAE